MATGIQTYLASSAERKLLEAGDPPDPRSIRSVPTFGRRGKSVLDDSWMGKVICFALECAHAKDDTSYIDLALATLPQEPFFRTGGPDPHEYLARILIERGEYPQAVALLRGLLALRLPFFYLGGARRRRNSIIRTTLAEALLALHQLDEAANLIVRAEVQSDGRVSIGEALRIASAPLGLVSREALVLAEVALLQGDPLEAMRQIGPHFGISLPPLYRSVFSLRAALILTRCGEIDRAECLLGQAQDSRGYLGLAKRLRTLVLAELEGVKGNIELSLSCFRALAELGHPSALGYLRASQLAGKISDSKLSRYFLSKAMELDPQSHWAEIAAQRLQGES